MSSKSILWVQSGDHSGEDFVYVDGLTIDKHHSHYSDYVKEVLSVNRKGMIKESESLSIYKSGTNCYQIASNLSNKDSVGRRLAFFAKVSVTSYEEVASALERLINTCGYQIESANISLIDDTLKKKARLNHLLKTSASVLLPVIIMTLLISMCQK